MSSVPIITEIKNKIDIAVNTISDIEEVHTFPFVSTIFELMMYPAVLIYLEPTNWENRNRLERHDVNINIEVWYEVSEDVEKLSTQGELLEALVHQAIFTSCGDKINGLAKYIQKITKNPPDYQFPQEGLGVVKMQYAISYLTVWGNGFSQANY